MAEFDEGERRREDKRWRPSSFAPLVKITQPGRIGATDSWQTLLAIEALPLEGLQFPGSEFFTIADRVPGFDIDWAARISKTSREQAIARNTKNLRRLNEQVGERDSEVSFAQDTLSEQVLLLGEYNGHLESNDDEIEVSLCPIFSVAGTTRAHCEDGALKLVQAFERNRIKVVAPLGGQRELWAAMNPGGSNLRAVADFSHVTISEYAAASVPCATNDVGDVRGPIFALNLSGRRNQPVHLEWFREASRDASPSVAFAGELGAGKTWAIMTLLFHLVDIGGQFLAIDRTDQGEYASPVSTLANSVVVDMMRPRWSMDPLRIFPADIGVDKAVDLLTPLFGCTADSPQGLTLGELLHPELGVRSIPDMLAVLQEGIDTGAMPGGKKGAAGGLGRTAPAPGLLVAQALRRGADGSEPGAAEPQRRGHRHPHQPRRGAHRRRSRQRGPDRPEQGVRPRHLRVVHRDRPPSVRLQQTPHGCGRDGRGLPRHLDATRSGQRHPHRA